jgi:hypothetical protein
MFRKKTTPITVDVCNDLVQDIKIRFRSSEAPAYIKAKLEHITPIFIFINRPKWMFYGQAWCVSKWAKKDATKKKYKLREATHPMTMIDGNKYFMIIQINKGLLHTLINNVTHRGLRYLVAHELAHLLQFYVDEHVSTTYSFCVGDDHGTKWGNYVRWMGGTGSKVVPRSEIWI